MSIKYLLLVGIVGLGLCNAPTPNCTVGAFWKMLPITQFENSRLNLDDMIKGFNLEYSIEDATDLPFVQLQSKFSQNAQQNLIDDPLTGLKSYHLNHIGNGWGTGFIALTEIGAKTTIHYGLMDDNKSAPTIGTRTEVEKQPNITCFDAILFPAQNLIIVDCMLKLDGKSGKKFQNRFVYVDLNSGAIMPYHVDTEMYVQFDSVTRRRMLQYTDPQSGYHYLLRSYFADGVSPKHSLNTYIDVFIINDPKRPWTLKVIDRTLLHQTELSITDFQMYLGDIYVLDNRRGLYRMDITVHQQIIITGRYQAEGFTRFGVFSNNLDDAFEIALANSHSVYEIDWSRTVYPVLLTKYSLLPDSTIEQVALNQNYLVVQSFSKVNTSSGPVVYNYTWIYNRGDRMYNKAFKVINHNTYKTFIDMNRQLSYLMVIDDETITNYALKQPILSVFPKKQDDTKMNTPLNFTIRARSLDPLSNVRVTCTMVYNFTIVYDTNKTIWDSGYKPYNEYSANYPGKLEIPLFEYALGPNITYEVKPTGDGDAPERLQVLQQDLTRMYWQHSPGMMTTRFLKTQQFRQSGNNTITVYLQDAQNILYISNCTTSTLSLDVYCNQTDTEDVGGALTFFATTRFDSIETLKNHHMLAYSTNAHPNQIFINDFTYRRRVAELEFPEGYAGQINSMEITSRYMFIVQKYIKTILVYDLDRCLARNCSAIYKIDVFLMAKIGVKYFNPLEVYTSIFHPEVVFIRTPTSVLILDVDRQGVPVLLSQIVSDATKKSDTVFKMAINFDFLIIANSPGIIQQYALDQLYEKRIIHTKNYPLYGYTIPAVFDLDMSDRGDTIYITTERDGLKDIFVYRGGYPNVGSLYDTIQLGSYNNMLIDVTGYYLDFVTVVSGSFIRMFKQYELPVVVVESAFRDYSFDIEFYNDASAESNMTRVAVKVQNWPTKIEVNPYYLDVMNTRDLVYSGENKISEFDDQGWYTGNVLTIKAECTDCGDKVIVKGHIHEQRDVVVAEGISEYQWGFDGGSVQQTNNVFHMKHNGSLDQVVRLPHTANKRCHRIAVPLVGSYHVSACQTARGIDMYVTSFLSSKGFSWGPYASGAVHATRIEVVRELVMLVDTDPQPGLFKRAGGVFIYAINILPDDDDAFTELDYIDSDDFGGVTEWDDSQTAYIANAEMTYTYEIDTYRIIMTESRGLFVVDFTWQTGRDEISLKKVNFINVHKTLAENGYRMPFDANFQAITVMTSFYDRTSGLQNQTILMTTGRFHTFQFQLITDKNGNVQHFELIRVYLRYSFYHVNNYVRYFDDYMVVTQTLPDDHDTGNYNQQILTVYHTKGQFNGTVEKRSLRGAYLMPTRTPYNFDFNWTFYDRRNGSEESRVGLLLIDPLNNAVKQLTLYKNIQIITKEELPTQIIYLDLINDFSTEKIRLYMHGTATFPTWKTVLISVFSVIGGLILLGVGFMVFMRWKARRDEASGVRESKDSLMSEGS